MTNLFFAQAIADHFQAHLVIGLDDLEKESRNCYSAAFSLNPDTKIPMRYEKRVLVPLAEYLPFEWLRSWTASYGITEFFLHGKEAKVFQASYPYSVSICYEETFRHYARRAKQGGGALCQHYKRWLVPIFYTAETAL